MFGDVALLEGESLPKYHALHSLLQSLPSIYKMVLTVTLFHCKGMFRCLCLCFVLEYTIVLIVLCIRLD